MPNLHTPYKTPAQEIEERTNRYKELWVMFRSRWEGKEYDEWAAKVYVSGQHQSLNKGYIDYEERQNEKAEHYT